MNVAETLDRAADLLEREGWIQARKRRRAGGKIVGRCVIGALEDSTGDPWITPEFSDAMDRFCTTIGREGVAAWNDAPERTQEEVIAALRMAAERERQET